MGSAVWCIGFIFLILQSISDYFICKVIIIYVRELCGGIALKKIQINTAVAIISLIFQPNEHIQFNICIFSEYLLLVSALTAQSGRNYRFSKSVCLL
jgi:hypothetical protein